MGGRNDTNSNSNNSGIMEKEEFDLLKIHSKKDSLSGKVTLTETPHFQIPMAIIVSMILSIFVLYWMNYDIPGWAEMLMSSGLVIAYTIGFIALFFSINAGKINLSDTKISVYPKKNSDEYPAHPIKLNEDSVIRINIIQSYRFILSRSLLHMEITNGDSTHEFGMILKSRKKHERFKEILDNWYRSGFTVKENDQLGNRIFKLSHGINYAEVQKIKNEYGIEW